MTDTFSSIEPNDGHFNLCWLYMTDTLPYTDPNDGHFFLYRAK